MTNRIRSLTKLLLTGFLGLLVAACGGVGETKDPIEAEPFFQAPDEEWELVWSDEFNGTTLNTANWNFDLGDGSDRGLQGWGNQEAQWYTPDNVEVSDGTLKITAQVEERVAGFPYTSSRITTKDKVDFTYGRVEARIKAPTGQGLWSAFWMLSTDSPYGSDGWAATGEIDIFEAINPNTGTNLDFTGATIYHGFPFAFQQRVNQRYADLTRLSGFDATTDFHVYAVEWEEKELRFFVDDVHVKTITNQSYYSYYYDDAAQRYTLGPDGAPFNVDFHIILNVAVGGTATGFNVNEANLPGSMEVDYVRVYRCTYDLPGGNGCNVNVDPTVVPEGTNDTGRIVPNRPFTDSFDLFIDEPNLFVWNIGGDIFERQLEIGSFDNNGAMTYSVVAAADTSRGNVIEAVSTGGGNIYLTPDDGDTLGVFGMGNNPNPLELGAGEIRFDILINSADAGSQFLVKMDSGFPDLGQVAFDFDDYATGQWHTISVKVNDINAFRGDGFNPIDTSELVNLFVFEPTGAASVQLDNITLSCGIPGEGDCGLIPPDVPLPVITGPFRLEGTWRMAAEPGSLGVGPTEGSTEWFATSSQDLTIRGCYFNDDYIFGGDGSFMIDLGDETWLEPWQSGVAEACGVPVPPHDGAAEDYTYEYDTDAGTLTLNGEGAFIGLPKAVNNGQLDEDAFVPGSVTYNLEEVGNNRMILTIDTDPAGEGRWWRFALNKTADPNSGGGVPERTFAGGWQVTPVAGSLGIGPARGDISWWSIDDAGVDTRSCFYDDLYSFDRDGSFINELGADTWLEAWQGVAGEECGAPVAPYDGTNMDATWSYTEIDADTGTLTLDGAGAYMGIPKARNDGEIGGSLTPGAEAPNVTYQVSWEDDNNVILDIEAGAASNVWWRFLMTKTVQPPPLGDAEPVVGTWVVAPEAQSLGVGPAQGDISWWSIDDAGVTTRSCFYDDTYEISSDGSFTNVLGSETWLEAWQGVAGEECGTPVAPYDGSNMDATWSYTEIDADTGTLTLDGAGAFMGIPKARNDGEIGASVDPGFEAPTVTYQVMFEDANTMILDIEPGTGVWWRFKMVKQ